LKKLSDIVKHGLLITIFIVLWTPFAIQYFTDEDFFPLKGAVTLPSDITFSKKEWISAEYQQKKEEYLISSFGFRSLFVRLNNQIAFNLFKKAKANGVIVGKENYLYEEGYINAYYGKDYLGEDSINHTIERLKFISDTLSKLGKHLIVVFAPGKASFFSEYIPDSYLPKSEKTNYKTFSAKAKESQLNVIDFNKWFIDNKSISKYPLYPKYGIHWSFYGAVLAADSLTRKIGNLRHVVLPKIKIMEIRMDKPFDSDYDIADGMNLLLKSSSFEMAYPKIDIENSDKNTKPKILVISDSYYWALYNLGISNCFQNDHFWYYNKQVFPESATNELLTDNLNIVEEINKHDVVVIIATEATLPKIGWGFIEKTESLYKGITLKTVKDSTYYKKVNELIQLIRSNEKWLIDATKRANEKNISVDSSLVLEAMWQIENTK
jgi:hypothetical protein